MSEDLNNVVESFKQTNKAFLDFIQEEKVTREAENKQRKWVRIGIISFFAAGILLYVAMIGKLFMDGSNPSDDYVSIVTMEGAIMPGGANSAESVIDALKKAFKDEDSKGVILKVNSPGGTPTQASIIYDNIKRLKAEFPEKKFVVIGEDSMTSGAYMVAVASDKIYINRSSVVGSIGVVMQGYGFSDLAKRFGVERRVFTAGENKVRMDPFLPLQEDDRLKVNETLAEIHQEFIHIVKEGRGCVPDNAPTCKLKLKTDGLFSGDIWTGSKAIEIGLVDEVGDLYSVMKQDFNVENYVNIPTKRPMFGKLGQWLSSSAEDIVFEAVRRAAESESSLGAFELK